MDYLTGHKFDIGGLFTQGVRYLSRQEEVAAREASARKWAPVDSMEDLEDQLRDEGSIRFLQAVRREIDTWTAKGKVSFSSFLGHHPEPPPVKLTVD